MTRHHALYRWTEPLEMRRLLSFDPTLAGGIEQNGHGFPYGWNAGNFSSDSILLTNDRLGNMIGTGFGYSVQSPNPPMTDEPILEDARFLLRGNTQPIGTMVVRNSQASGDRAESYWHVQSGVTSYWERVHNDGFWFNNTASGTNSTIVFDNVDSSDIEAYQSFIFDSGSARQIIFRNCTWNEKVTLKVQPGCTIGRVVFQNCRGNVDFLMMGGTLGQVYNNDPSNCGLSSNVQAITGLPDDMAQPAPYNGTPLAMTGSGTNIIEAENFDTNGEGLSYHDTSYEDASTQVYRRSLSNGPATGSYPRVDLAAGGSNGWTVSSVKAGEWIDYTLDVQTPGMYRLDSLLRSAGGGAQWRVSIGGRYLQFAGQNGLYAPLPNTGGAFSTVSSDSIFLPAGKQVMTVQFGHATSATADIGDFDYFQLVKTADPTIAPTAPVNLRLGNADGATEQGTRDSLSFAWDGVGGAAGYDIGRADGSGQYQVVGQILGSAQDDKGAVTDFTDQRLSPATTYTYAVRAFNSAGHSAWSAPLTAVTKPAPTPVGAPTNFYVRQEATTSSQGTPISTLSFHWTAAGSNERAFKIERWGSWGGYDIITGNSAGSSGQTFSGPAVGTLDETAMNRFDTAYKIRLAAVDVESRAYAPTIILPADAGFESGLISSGWTVADGIAVAGPGGNTGNYAALLSPGATIQQTLTNLTPNTTYTLSAMAYAGIGGSMTLGVKGFGASALETSVGSPFYQEGTVTFTTSSTGSATIYATAVGGAGAVDDFELVETQPSSPVLLDPVATAKNVTLNWTIDNTQNLDGIEIWRSNDGINWIDVTSPNRLPASQRTYVDSQALLQTGTTFYYQVRAAQKGDQPSQTGAYYGQPNYSNTVKVVMAHAPVAPSGLHATTLMPHLIELRWNDASSSNDEWGFQIERSTDGVNYQTIATTPTNVTRFMDSDVPDGAAQVFYRVRSFTGATSSSSSDTVVSIDNSGGDPDPGGGGGDPTDPSAPSNLRATDGDANEIDLAWDGTSTGAFTIQRSSDGSHWSVLASTLSNVYSDMTVTPAGGLYYYRVVAQGPSGPTAPSNVIIRRAQSPFGSAHISSTPGLIEAEAFDEGGEGVSYHSPDVTAGASHRADVTDGGIDLGSDGTHSWVAARAGQWLEYTVNISRDAVYDLNFNISSAGPGGTFHVEVDGQPAYWIVQAVDTGAANQFVTATHSGVFLGAGTHVLRLVMDYGTWQSNAVANFDSIELVEREYVDQGILHLSGGAGDDNYSISASTDGVQVSSYTAMNTWTGVSAIQADMGQGSDWISVDEADAPLTLGSLSNVELLIVNQGKVNVGSDMGAGAVKPSVQVGWGAQVNFVTTQHLASLDVAPTAIVTLAGGRDKVLSLDSLNIGQGYETEGTLDLVDNALALNYSWYNPISSIQQWIADGRRTGQGLIASDSADSSFSSFSRALVAIDNNSAHFSSLKGVGLDGYSQVLVKYDYFGDTNFDGIVTPRDYAVIDGNIGLGSSWDTGDLDGDGKVTPGDYAQVDGNIGAGAGGAGGPSLT